MSSVNWKGIRMRVLGIVLSIFILPPSAFTQTNEGTEFWFSFLEHRNPGLNTKVAMITSRFNTAGVISAPLAGFSRTFAVTANEVTIIELPEFAETLGSETVSNNGFRIESNDLVSVYIHQYYQYRAEATVVLPVSTIGREYYALSYNGFFTQNELFASQFLLVASQDETTITVRLAGNTRAGKSTGSSFNIILNAGETYQVQGARDEDDFSGTYITADKNFSVFCGNRYTALNCFRSGRDNLLEQAFPVSTWGTQFVSVPFQTNIKDIFRILASEDNTIVEAHFEDGRQVSYNVNSGEFVEYEELRVSFIESNRPILVAQYMNQLDCGNGRTGDPSMLYLNSVLQIRDTVTLYNSSFQNIQENYINIIARTSDISKVLFDGALLIDMGIPLITAGKNGEFTSATIRVNTGAHTIISEGCGVIAKAYGLGDHESYAYSGGASFTKINASPIPDGGCLNDTVFFNTELPEDRYAVQWIFEEGDTVHEHEFMRFYDELGSFGARLFIHDQCFDLFDTLEKELQITLMQSVDTEALDIFCQGEDVLLGASDLAMATYEWTGPLEYFSEEQNPTIANAQPQMSGIYEVIGIVSGCATFPAQVNLEIKPNPMPSLGPDAVFCPRAEFDTVLDPGDYHSYLWGDGSTDQTILLDAEGDYQLTVMDEFGCIGFDSVSIRQQCPTQVYIPNVFSPNGDNINDEFGIFGEDIISIDLRVFDRWGNQVFQSADENFLWDGRLDNGHTLSGVYSWLLVLEGFEEDGSVFRSTQQGNVTLVK